MQATSNKIPHDILELMDAGYITYIDWRDRLSDDEIRILSQVLKTMRSREKS